MSRRGWINVVVMQLVLGMECWADITRMPLATSRPGVQGGGVPQEATPKPSSVGEGGRKLDSPHPGLPGCGCLASHPPFILSMAVSASQNVIDRAYDIRILNQTVDFVSVSTYDFHTYHSYLPFTGHGAPLRPQKAEHGHWATLNTEWAVRYWLRRGLPHEKLVVTIPTYANTWKLLSSAWTRVGAPADGLGMMDGRMTYSQVCVFVQEGSGWQWDEASRVPYAWRSREWVSYEDDQSVKEKAQLVMTEDLAGVAVLDLNSDDWGGLCPGTTTFPLLRAVKNVTSRSEI